MQLMTPPSDGTGRSAEVVGNYVNHDGTPFYIQELREVTRVLPENRRACADVPLLLVSPNNSEAGARAASRVIGSF